MENVFHNTCSSNFNVKLTAYASRSLKNGLTMYKIWLTIVGAEQKVNIITLDTIKCTKEQVEKYLIAIEKYGIFNARKIHKTSDGFYKSNEKVSAFHSVLLDTVSQIYRQYDLKNAGDKQRALFEACSRECEKNPSLIDEFNKDGTGNSLRYFVMQMALERVAE